MFALLLPSLLLAASLVATSRANVCDGLHGVPLITSDSGVAAFGSDWGAISYGEPACVAVPTSVEQVQHVIKYARLHGLQVTARGNGHSTGGQTLAANNIVIDTKGFDAVALGPNNAYVEAGVGAFWFDVVAEAAPVGKRPAAIVDTVSETTVGGVVSLGGTSAIALTNGLLVDAVISFEAVDAKGNIHRGVSATHEKALFAAVRGGSGQFAIVTSVRIRLVDVVPVAVPDGAIDATGGQLPAAVIAHAFVFADDALFANYVLQLHATAGAASVDGADIISLKNDVSLFTAVFGATAGGAIYGLVTSTLSPTAKFFHIVNVVDFAPLNPALAIPPTGSQPIGTTAFSWLTFAFRNVDQFARAHQSLAWYAPKATRVVFVPHDTKTVDLITKVLAKLGSSAEFYGDILPACQLSLKLLDTSLISATTLVRVPRLTRDAIEIGVICLDDVASSQAQTSNTNLAQRQRHLQSEIDALIRAEAHANWGAENVKAYSWNSQWECWHDHFGSAWPVVVALKQHYDPCVILGRGAGIFPQQRTRACSTGIDQPFECSFGSESSSDASTSDSIDSDDSKHLHLLQNALNVDVSDLKH